MATKNTGLESAKGNKPAHIPMGKSGKKGEKSEQKPAPIAPIAQIETIAPLNGTPSDTGAHEELSETPPAPPAPVNSGFPDYIPQSATPPVAKGKKSKPATRVPSITTDILQSKLTIIFRADELHSKENELCIDVNQLTPEIRLAAALHGLKQKLVDAAAIAKNTDTGLSATLDDKYAAVRAVYDRLIDPENPTWNAIRDGSGATNQNRGVFLRAMCALTGKTPDAMKVLLDDYTKEKLAALKKNARVVEKMNEIQLADAKAGNTADSDELLDSLMAGGEDAEEGDNSANDEDDEDDEKSE